MSLHHARRRLIRGRCSAVVATVLVAGAFSAVAEAAAPSIRLAGRLGHVTLPTNGGCTSTPTVGQCADPVPPSWIPELPELAVAAGEALRVTVSRSWTSEPTVSLTEPTRSLRVFRRGPLQYRFTLPRILRPVSDMTIVGMWERPPERGDSIHYARLRLALAAEAERRARFDATHVEWAVTCPRRAGLDCAGTATIRLATVIASESFARLPPGQSRAFSSRVRPSVLRRLEADPERALRAVVRPSLRRLRGSTTVVRLRAAG